MTTRRAALLPDPPPPLPPHLDAAILQLIEALARAAARADHARVEKGQT